MKKQSYEINDANQVYYSDADTSLFKPELDAKKALELISWAVVGYGEKVLRETKDAENLDYDAIGADFDAYLNELRKAYYKNGRKNNHDVQRRSQ